MHGIVVHDQSLQQVLLDVFVFPRRGFIIIDPLEVIFKHQVLVKHEGLLQEKLEHVEQTEIDGLD